MSDAERAAILERGIRAFLVGDYSHPKSFRPNGCEHGRPFYEECCQCDAAHFDRVLAAAGVTP